MKRYLFVLLLLLVSPLLRAQTIQTNTSISITISGVPTEEMARFNGAKYLVSPTGMVNMPFIGQVRAAGLSGAQLGSVLQSAYQRAGYYLSPTFQVIPDSITAEVAQLSVMVGGDVRRPGPVPYQQSLTLWGAVQAAGGENEFGSVKRVRLTRNGNSKVYDLSKPQFHTIPLYANDSVQVPRKNLWGN